MICKVESNFTIATISTLFLPFAGLCDSLSNPDNGVVKVSDESTAIYTCNSGYELVGNATQLCDDSGAWTPEPPPTCEPGEFEVYIRYVCVCCYWVLREHSKPCKPSRTLYLAIFVLRISKYSND